MSRKPRLGLALGSGSARGWAHIGVIKALTEAGIKPDIVCGSSIGALVGAAYVSGHLQPLEEWIRTLRRFDIIGLMDAQLTGGGFMQGGKLMEALGKRVGNLDIQDLDIHYAAIATDLDTGREVWLREGDLLDAVRASIALPGLFTPHQRDGSWLIDGGLCNPVPVSVCRAMGADVVIAVNLNGELVGRTFAHLQPEKKQPTPEDEEAESALSRWLAKLNGGLRVKVDELISSVRHDETPSPGLFDVMAGAINIMQDRITRSRMAGDPPEILISPHLSHIRLMEFDRAAEAIEEGERAVHRERRALEPFAQRKA